MPIHTRFLHSEDIYNSDSSTHIAIKKRYAAERERIYDAELEAFRMSAGGRNADSDSDDEVLWKEMCSSRLAGNTIATPECKKTDVSEMYNESQDSKVQHHGDPVIQGEPDVAYKEREDEDDPGMWDHLNARYNQPGSSDEEGWDAYRSGDKNWRSCVPKKTKAERIAKCTTVAQRNNAVSTDNSEPGSGLDKDYIVSKKNGKSKRELESQGSIPQNQGQVIKREQTVNTEQEDGDDDEPGMWDHLNARYNQPGSSDEEGWDAYRRGDKNWRSCVAKTPGSKPDMNNVITTLEKDEGNNEINSRKSEARLSQNGDTNRSPVTIQASMGRAVTSPVAKVTPAKHGINPTASINGINVSQGADLKVAPPASTVPSAHAKQGWEIDEYSILDDDDEAYTMHLIKVERKRSVESGLKKRATRNKK